MKQAIIEALGEGYCNIERIRRNKKRWYKVIDICGILGLKNTSVSARGNFRIGYYTVDPKEIIKDGEHKNSPLFVSEAGLYCIILKSRKPIAMRLKNIISFQVLPEIMRTGKYGGEKGRMVDSSQVRQRESCL